MMKIKTEAYNVYGEFLPEQEYEAVSSFECSISETEKDPPFPTPVVLGVWVSTGTGNKVEPIYLTQAQLDKLRESL